jgi:negative regulator of genetic competence, sporulation and motility
MEIHSTGNGNFFIYVDKPEIKGYADEGDVDAEAIVELVRQTREAPGDTYLEVFQGRESLLIFARSHAGTPTIFVFNSIEPLIAAARACPSESITFLAHASESYYLIYYPWDSESPPAALCEFGEVAREHPAFARHIAEHGRVLLGPTALEDLNAIF